MDINITLMKYFTKPSKWIAGVKTVLRNSFRKVLKFINGWRVSTALNQQARNKFRVTSSIAKFISQSSKIHKWQGGSAVFNQHARNKFRVTSSIAEFNLQSSKNS